MPVIGPHVQTNHDMVGMPIMKYIEYRSPRKTASFVMNVISQITICRYSNYGRKVSVRHARKAFN